MKPRDVRSEGPFDLEVVSNATLVRAHFVDRLALVGLWGLVLTVDKSITETTPDHVVVQPILFPGAFSSSSFPLHVLLTDLGCWTPMGHTIFRSYITQCPPRPALAL